MPIRAIDRQLIDTLAPAAEQARGLRLLVLFGSRAQGDARADSDWDLAYLADETFDPDALYVTASGVLNTDEIYLVNLNRLNGLMRYNVASRGLVVYEQPGEWERFWMETVTFWCDVEPVLREGYEAILARYQR